MGSSGAALTNAEIADLLLSLAQSLSAQKENPFKVKAYRRAGKTIANLAESVDELVKAGADLTAYPGIGSSIARAVQEMVHLRPEVAATSQFAKPDARILIHEAHAVAASVQHFLLNKCGASRAEAAGTYRRRVEVIEELSFVVEAEDFPNLATNFERFGGRATVLTSDSGAAQFQLPSGVRVRLTQASPRQWGLSLIVATGSEEHLKELTDAGLMNLITANASYRTERAVYRKLRLEEIPPELREGKNEVELAGSGRLPKLVAIADICGELHAHSTSSDGAHTIEQMAAAARERGYEYLGITDHSQSLKIARGVSERDLLEQIRFIDQLNERGDAGIQILKSSEVDILEDGSLDYPDELLKELDYTVCSIHSKFRLSKPAQTERLMRAMDNRYFNILGHATGRRLLRRPGYEFDIERVVKHAGSNGCFFEINSSPQRLDLSAENARLASAAGIRIAISTDAHSTRELGYIAGGIEQARRAGLDSKSVLNCISWPKLRKMLKR